MRIRATILLFIVLILSASFNIKQDEYDICIYGGTSSGVIAAYTAAMMGKKVLLVEPGNHVGGLSSGGLGYTDIGNNNAISGVSRDFYRKIGEHYGKLEQWSPQPYIRESRRIIGAYVYDPA